MHAIILAAGEGKRFNHEGLEKRPLPDGFDYPIPKSLVPVKDPKATDVEEYRPILARLIDALFKGGIESAFIGTGYLHGLVQEFVDGHVEGKKVTVFPPDPSIDYSRGPLFTLATVMKHFREEGIVDAKGFDKILLLLPADLVIDPRGIWFMVGPSSRGMMASRKLLHIFVEDRKTVEKPSTLLEDVIPERFHEFFTPKLLSSAIVPVMGAHVDVLMDITKDLDGNQAKFALALKAWIDENIEGEYELNLNLNLIKASLIGQNFYWFDIDDQNDIVGNNL